jgi:predicted transcriptional regulator
MRIEIIKNLISEKPMRQVDLARELNVHKSTISRDIRDMSLFFPIAEDERGLVSYVD